jgi:RNA polymerase sigma-70 factor (ECF subfamily)
VSAHAALAATCKASHGRLVAQLARRHGLDRLADIEDAVQQAFVAALRHWPFDGVPDNPGAWLATAARHALLDTLRAGARIEPLDDKDAPLPERVHADDRGERFAAELDDDELALLFAVCDPALPLPAQVALALRLFGGFNLRELATHLMTGEAALAKRLERARDALAAQGRPALPSPDVLPARRHAVLAAIYVMFNEGYQSADGHHYERRELAWEAVRLARALAAHPTTACGEADALAALLLLSGARIGGRTGPDGQPLAWAEQLPARWDRGLIALGLRHFGRAMRGASLTSFHVQAAIAVEHARAVDGSAPDWARIVAHYDQLVRIDPTPAPRLARAIAIGQLRGPAAGLAEVDAVMQALPAARYPFGHVARGDFLAALGRAQDARDAWRSARAQARSVAEAQLIEARLQRENQSAHDGGG